MATKKNELTVIDFSAAIESAPINYNFALIQKWIERERLRTAGWGLVEGFDCSYDYNFGIDITEGILIDHYGKEIMVDAIKLYCGYPEYETITETVVVSDEGDIVLKFTPYSPKNLGIIVYNPPQDKTKPDIAELQIKEATSLMKMNPLSVVQNVISVSTAWAGKTAVVTYHYCNDRVDAILLDEEGHYSREIGILSETPSATDVDLSDKFLVAFAYWHVERTIWCEFLINDRTYRKVYVDKLNRLFLNGKLYKEAKWIYFEEPESPEEWDVWYDHKTNSLMVYCLTDGVWGWRVMNDFTNVPLRSIRMWAESENPADLQTFLFNDDETDLRFIPDTNAIEVIIDQQVVMADQFTEVVIPGSKPYLSSGIGFKLNTPLDRATDVQCVIHHIVKNAPLRNVFQRAAIFVDENFHIFVASNTDQVFETTLPYVIAASQLEVFVNGMRLNPTTDFIEMLNATTIASTADKDKTTRHFKVIVPLAAGDKITYKISRYVWSYDQLNSMVDDIESKADQALLETDSLQNQINNLSANIAAKFSAIDSALSSIQTTLGTMSDYRLKADPIQLSDLANNIRESLKNNIRTYTFNAADTGNVINDITANDFVTVVCINGNSSQVLRQDIEFMLAYNIANNSATLNVLAELMSVDNTLYVNVIHFGL